MFDESFPEIVFDISLPLERVLSEISETLANSSRISIVDHNSDAHWRLSNLQENEKITAIFELFAANQGEYSRLYFSANSLEDSGRLGNSVFAFLEEAFAKSMVLGPNLEPLSSLPGPSEASAERIATLLQRGEAMTVEEIGKRLSMREYTVAINLQNLLGKRIVGCTPPSTVPRKYFCM